MLKQEHQWRSHQAQDENSESVRLEDVCPKSVPNHHLPSGSSRTAPLPWAERRGRIPGPPNRCALRVAK
eukprot:scaffold700_cov113-Skeletonema_dohrnii-CCMP3373.AAC.3